MNRLTTWWILRWYPRERGYRIVGTTPARSAPEALLSQPEWKGDSTLIARLENDSTVPIIQSMAP